jgi:beta-glucanase (GH16 family)
MGLSRVGAHTVRPVASRAAALALVLAGATLPGVQCGSPPNTPTSSVTSTAGWADEFDGPANALPDAAKWTYDLGGGGWGNNELETYTNQPENVHLDGAGHLVIHVDRTTTGYTSARLKTQGLFSTKYGRIDARIKLPSGQGLWPAFWMLGASFNGSNWPQCGEVDIMENVGREPSTNHGSAHGPGYSGGNAITGIFTLAGARFADDFHVFSLDWSAARLAFLVDGTLYRTVTPSSLPGGAPWVFDNPFFLVLNFAVGGNFPGAPDATTVFPQEMIVDYVRVSGGT